MNGFVGQDIFFSNAYLLSKKVCNCKERTLRSISNSLVIVSNPLD